MILQLVHLKEITVVLVLLNPQQLFLQEAEEAQVALVEILVVTLEALVELEVI